MERFLVGSALVVAALIAAGSIFGTQSFEFRIDDDDKPAAVQGAPAAQGVETRYTAQSFDLRGAAGVLVVTPEDRTDIAVKITGGAKLPPIKAQVTGDRLVLDGGLGRRVRHCRTGEPFGATVSGYGELSGADLPRIEIRTPKTLKLGVADGVFTKVGPSDALDASFAGCGDAVIGDVKGRLEINSAGSGDVVAGAAQSANVSLAGSGQIELGTITQGLEASIAGSGSTRAKSVTGPLSASIAGSGDVDVDGGAVSDASVSIAGSGDVSIEAPVVNLRASIMGSGDIDVAAVSGALERTVMGSGSVNVGAGKSPNAAAPASPAAPPSPPAPPKP
ncbi:MAG: GIN domain-containing protein [Caulobacterales bacterium]|jgi:hypothetical protein